MKRASLVVVSSILVACGGSSPPPTPPAADTTPPVSSPSSSSSSSSPPSSSGAPASAASEDAGAPAKPVSETGAPSSSSTNDECTPVSVEFEKRARPKLKECYQAGKKKDPNLAGTVKIKVTVDLKGKIKATKVVEKSLPDPVADCMLKVVKTTAFPEVEKCWDSTITLPITFPTPK